MERQGRAGLLAQRGGAYHGLSHAELLEQRIALEGEGVVEKVPDKGAHSARVRRRAKGQQEEGKIET